MSSAPSDEDFVVSNPKLFPSFALYRLSSSALTSCNTDCPLKIFTPFRRTCQGLLMTSAIARAEGEFAKLEAEDRSGLDSFLQFASGYNLFKKSYYFAKQFRFDLPEDVIETMLTMAHRRAKMKLLTDAQTEALDTLESKLEKREAAKDKSHPEEKEKKSNNSSGSDQEEEEEKEDADSDGEDDEQRGIPSVLCDVSGVDHRAYWATEIYACTLLHKNVEVETRYGWYLDLLMACAVPLASDPAIMLKLWQRLGLKRAEDVPGYDPANPMTEGMQLSLVRRQFQIRIVQLWHLGLMLKALGLLEAAAIVFGQARISEPRYSGNYFLFLRQEAWCHLRLDHNELAIELYRDLKEKSTAVSDVRDGTFFLGLLYRKTKNYERAIELSKERLAELLPLPNVLPRALANVHFTIATSYRDMGEFETSLEWARKGPEVFETPDRNWKTQYKFAHADSLESVAWHLEFAGLWDESEQVLFKALQLCEEEVKRLRIDEGKQPDKDDDIRDKTHIKLALVYLLTRPDTHMDKAEEHFKEARQYLNKDDDWRVGFYHSAYALCKEKLNDKEAVLAQVCALLQHKVEGRSTVVDLPWCRTPWDVENRVLYADSTEPMDILVERAKSTRNGADWIIEGFASAIRICTKMHPERGNIKVSAATYKSMEDHVEDAGAAPYQELMRAALKVMTVV